MADIEAIDTPRRGAINVNPPSESSPLLRLRTNVRFEEPNSSNANMTPQTPSQGEPQTPDSIFQVRFDTKPRSYRKSDLNTRSFFRQVLDQILIVAFTIGFISATIGLLSLEQDASDYHLTFKIFYSTGTFLMLSVFLLQFGPKKSTQRCNLYISLSLLAAILILLVPLVFWAALYTHRVTLPAAFFGGQCVLNYYVAFERLKFV